MRSNQVPDPVPSTSRGQGSPPAAPAPAANRKRTADDEKNAGGKNDNSKVPKKWEGNGQENTIAVDKKVLDLLECPVCLDLVRIGRPVYSCANGHVVCNGCYASILGSCPTCRDKSIAMNKCVERMAAQTLKNVRIKCVFAERGCSLCLPMSAMDAHEDACNYRDISCVGMYWRNCDWMGMARDLMTHRREARCFELCWWNDLGGAGKLSVSRNVTGNLEDAHGGIAWVPPRLMFDKSRITRAWPGIAAYIFVARRAVNGDWYIFVRSMGPSSTAKVTIEATKPDCNDADGGTTPTYIYRGGIYPVSADEKNAIRLDRALVIKDEQARALSRGNYLFKYTVTLTIPVAAAASAAGNQD